MPEYKELEHENYAIGKSESQEEAIDRAIDEIRKQNPETSFTITEYRYIGVQEDLELPSKHYKVKYKSKNNTDGVKVDVYPILADTLERAKWDTDPDEVDILWEAEVMDFANEYL